LLILFYFDHIKNLGGDQEMTRKKKIDNRLGARVTKNKNPFLNPGGGFDLIEKFPEYESKRKRKERRR